MGQIEHGGEPSPGATKRPVHLLVVDDEADVETLFRLRFRQEIRTGAFAPRFVTDPLHALSIVENDPVLEVLVTDLNMPRMTGIELLNRVSRLHSPVKTIVLTAYDDMANLRAAMMAGAFDFQVKPLSVDDLRATIAKAVVAVREQLAGEHARRQAHELAERNHFVEEVFGRYVSEDVKVHLLASPDGMGRTERRRVTVLVAEIRAFTTLAENLAPEGVVEVLNSYFDEVADVILRRNGTINEILGDAMLVLFGAPLDDPLAEQHAVAAAIELQLALVDLNRRHRSSGLPELAVAVGVHSGEAVVGTIGSSHRQRYAAVGRHVDLAGRVAREAVGGQVLISAATEVAMGDLVESANTFAVLATATGPAVTMHDVRRLREPLHLTVPDRRHPALTNREQQVAEHAAAGHSSKEIASMLFLSVRTVDSVLLRVYMKLQIEGRGELEAGLTSPVPGMLRSRHRA
ncbi:MAG: adenylylate/guanylate cyclase [Acidimicrobiales bacterium]|nr:adenylylate/guanylate cyclase [Acidimicrobiales bacterium]